MKSKKGEVANTCGYSSGQYCIFQTVAVAEGIKGPLEYLQV